MLICIQSSHLDLPKRRKFRWIFTWLWLFLCKSCLTRILTATKDFHRRGFVVHFPRLIHFFGTAKSGVNLRSTGSRLWSKTQTQEFSVNFRSLTLDLHLQMPFFVTLFQFNFPIFSLSAGTRFDPIPGWELHSSFLANLLLDSACFYSACRCCSEFLRLIICSGKNVKSNQITEIAEITKKSLTENFTIFITFWKLAQHY